MRQFRYAVKLTPDNDDGGYVVTFRSFGATRWRKSGRGSDEAQESSAAGGDSTPGLPLCAVPP